MRCRAFSITLTGAAHIWFTSLPNNLIDNFKGLAERFIHNFCFGVRPQKKTTHLLYVKQGKDESLRDYISRFNKEKLEVEDYKENIAMTALIGGL